MQFVDLLVEAGHRARTSRPGATWLTASARTGDGGTPSSASQVVSCSDELTYTMRPSPTQACAAERHRQCSPEVKTVAMARSAAVMLAAAAAGQLELRMAGLVAHGLLAVAILRQDPASLHRYEHRAEREVPGVHGLGRQLHAAAQVRQVLRGNAARTARRMLGSYAIGAPFGIKGTTITVRHNLSSDHAGSGIGAVSLKM